MPLPDSAAAALAQLPLASNFVAMPPLTVLQPSPEAARLLDLAAADPSLHATTIGANAHLTLDAGGAGQVSLHLRVRDGVADLRVDGAGAQALDIRSSEVRTALAGEGISLGRFEHSSLAVPPDGRSTGSQPSPSGGPPASTEAGPSSGAGAGSGSGFGSQSPDGRPQWNLDDRSTGQAPRPVPAGHAAPAGAAATPSSTQPARSRRRLHVTA